VFLLDDPPAAPPPSNLVGGKKARPEKRSSGRADAGPDDSPEWNGFLQTCLAHSSNPCQYFGGKARLAPRIAANLKSVRGGRAYLEPVAGSVSVLCRMTGERAAGDIISDLILVLTSVREARFSTPTTLARSCTARSGTPSRRR
jgi:hypothetical protein